MERREFLRGVAIGALGGTGVLVAACGASAPQAPQQESAATTAPGAAPETAPAEAPAQGEALPALDWQMATSWPVALDTIFGGAQTVADAVGTLTNGKFKITPRPAGDLAKATEVLDVVQSGAVPIGHTASYYYVGKTPVTAFGTALPFGLTAQQQNSWLYEGGGLAQLQEIYQAKFGVIQFPAGNTGAQMGGWFRNEINTVADLQGLKMRIPGLGGQVMTALGVTVQVLGANEIFQALQTGAVDAAEFVGPYDDEKLGFDQVAKYYYYPGWWEPGPTLEIQINKAQWDTLPKEYQEILKVAAYQANMTMLARYDARNNAALASLTGKGVTLKPYSEEILNAAEEAANKLFDDFAAKDADFKAIYEPWKEFRTNIYAWNNINEFSFANHMYAKLS